MNIFLIGFMGSGKSSVGRRLASQLGYDFVDSDLEIEKKAGKKIPEIFSEDGEPHFRSLEGEFLKNLEVDNVVISLGGGTPCNEENIQLMKSKGKSIYMTMSPKALVHRLVNSRNPRPLVQQYQGKPEELLKFIETKLAEREPYYLQADIHLDGLNVDAEKLGQIAQILQYH